MAMSDEHGLPGDKMDTKKMGIKQRMMANRKCKDCGKAKKNCNC